MARPKKDGRFINYFIDRDIYERLKRYAEEKGQSMTTAIERILDRHLKEYETQRQTLTVEALYCEQCNRLTEQERCPGCGSKHLRLPLMGDYCFLTEKELLWSAAMEQLLRDHDIPFVTSNALGAGLTSKLGVMQERIRFYVPFLKLKQAKILEEEFFSRKFEEKPEIPEEENGTEQ